MISAALSRRMQELAAARVEFVTATVVRAQSPTSVEPGAVGLVLGDGTIEGFIGGVCAEQSVRAHSLLALRSGEPVLLRILPDAPGAGIDPEPAEVEVATADGAVTVRNPCLSGGAIEIFLEPTPPPPRVLVVGETPIAEAIRRIGDELGLEMVAGEGEEPDPEGGNLGLIVAAHGRDELRALRRGLEAELPYVGLVASDKRGAGVIAELRADGVSEELLERIDVPAGFAIGARTAGEIAVSILARVVSVRRQASEPTPSTTEKLHVDPICGMTVAAGPGTPSLQDGAETVYFCSEGCKARYEVEREHAIAN